MPYSVGIFLLDEPIVTQVWVYGIVNLGFAENVVLVNHKEVPFTFTELEEDRYDSAISMV